MAHKFEDTLWEITNKELTTEWLNGIEDDFIRNPYLMGTLQASIDYLPLEWPLVSFTYHDSLLNFLTREPTVGKNITIEWMGREISPTTVHHLYHYCMYKLEMGKAFTDNVKIVEWGGGWGNQCRLTFGQNLRPDLTYTIIDTPVMCDVQEKYLSSLFPYVSRNEYKDSAINLIDIDNLVELPEQDAFISTWALSECREEAVDYVVEREWFGAKDILLAYDPQHEPFTNPSYIERYLDGFTFAQPIPERSKYAFK